MRRHDMRRSTSTGRMAWRSTTIVAVASLAACAGTGDGTRRADAVPVATAAGPAKSCIPISGIRESNVRSDSVIDFRMRGGETYRVTLPTPCPSLGFERRFSYATSLSQLCSADIITVLYQTGLARGASCGLAPFQPVKLPRP